VEKCERHKK